MLKVHGSKFIVFGDSHIDSEYRGKHINYYENSLWGLDTRLKLSQEENIDFYAETGDLSGARANIASVGNREMLAETVKFFKDLGVPSVINQGNHDMYGNERNNDYMFLSRIGAFKTPDIIKDQENGSVVCFESNLKDSNGNPLKDEDDLVPQIYVHFVKYGDEHIQLKPVKNAINVAITHGDFRVGGEVYSQSEDAIDLIHHKPFFGMDIIINGHIHQPHQPKTFTTVVGSECTFINIGSMARVTKMEDYSACFYVVMSFYKTPMGIAGVKFEPKLVKLKPATEIFIQEEQSALQKSDLIDADDDLSEAFQNLQNFEWAGTSLIDRIEVLQIPDSVKEIMFDALNKQATQKL